MSWSDRCSLAFEAIEAHRAMITYISISSFCNIPGRGSLVARGLQVLNSLPTWDITHVRQLVRDALVTIDADFLPRNLRTAADIAGTYSAVSAGLAVAGGETAQLHNSRGVVLRLRGQQLGFELSQSERGEHRSAVERTHIMPRTCSRLTAVLPCISYRRRIGSPCDAWLSALGADGCKQPSFSEW